MTIVLCDWYEREEYTEGLTYLFSVFPLLYSPSKRIKQHYMHIQQWTIMLMFHILPLLHKRNSEFCAVICLIERTNVNWLLTLQAERQFEATRNQMEEHTSWCTSEAQRIKGEMEAEKQILDMREREATEAFEVLILYVPHFRLLICQTLLYYEFLVSVCCCEGC